MLSAHFKKKKSPFPITILFAYRKLYSLYCIVGPVKSFAMAMGYGGGHLWPSKRIVIRYGLFGDFGSPFG